MAILDLKKKIEPYLKTATGYVKQMLSSKHVIMEDGNDLETTVTELNRKIKEQNTLWDGFLYMQGGQEIKLSTPIDQTKSGIVLVFSFVENEKAQDYAWHSFFVPKALVESRPGDGHQFNLFWNTWSQKYLYIHNDKIVGQPTNSNTQNKRFGLRKIIAV